MNFTLKHIEGESGLYKLDFFGGANRYYVISDEGTRHLMASPEVVGFESYQSMVRPTTYALGLLKEKEGIDHVNILTILRGGLNYPVEQSCHECGIRVSDISFLSCERIIHNGVIEGLDVKYEKLHTENDCVLLIGDIIASGDTLRLAIKHLVNRFVENGHNLKRVVFFTVGGTKAIDLMEEATADFRKIWPDFEGFDCFFYEGVFTVYEDKGVTGVNIPDIDFGWKGGAVSPEFREYVMKYEYAPSLLEKCIIYDGGARRYEIDEHKHELRSYWEDLRSVAGCADMVGFIEEKVGHRLDATYEEWLEACSYPADSELKELYELEGRVIGELASQSLEQICLSRLQQIDKTFKNY